MEAGNMVEKGEWLFLYINLFATYEAIETISIEITNNDSKNKVFNIVYRLPDGSVIKRPADSTSSTKNGLTNGQTSTAKGQTDPTKE